MRKPLSNKQRFDIFKRDGFTCQYCGASGDGVQLQIDHIEPVSKGGKCEDGNFITACKQCNSGKAASLLLPPVNLDFDNLPVCSVCDGKGVPANLFYFRVSCYEHEIALHCRNCIIEALFTLEHESAWGQGYFAAVGKFKDE